MNPDNSLSQIAGVISQKTSGLICLSQNPSRDSIASAVSLYHAITKLGKNVSIVCASQVNKEIVGSDKIQQSIQTSGNNLVISLPYQDGSIDKVDYSIQGDRFNLIISPKEGFPKLESENVKYSHAGGMIDFIITIDTPTLKNLDQVYLENENQFEGKTIINIDRHITNTLFGTINLVNKTASSTSEVIFQLLNVLGVEIDHDITTALYAGLTSATNNFTSYSVNAATFETAASLLKLGAKKSAVKKEAVKEFLQQPKIMEKAQISTLDSVEQEPHVAGEQENQAPEDWLKPKIFKSGGLI